MLKTGHTTPHTLQARLSIRFYQSKNTFTPKWLEKEFVAFLDGPKKNNILARSLVLGVEPPKCLDTLA